MLSELRRPKPHGAVVAWLTSITETSFFVPAIVLGEIQAGIELSRDRDPAKAAEIERWLDSVMATFSVVYMDGNIAREWARLKHGRSRDNFEDAMIAATARVLDLIVVTRNMRDFLPFDVQVLDPFDYRG